MSIAKFKITEDSTNRRNVILAYHKHWTTKEILDFLKNQIRSAFSVQSILSLNAIQVRVNHYLDLFKGECTDEEVKVALLECIDDLIGEGKLHRINKVGTDVAEYSTDKDEVEKAGIPKPAPWPFSLTAPVETGSAANDEVTGKRTARLAYAILKFLETAQGRQVNLAEIVNAFAHDFDMIGYKKGMSEYVVAEAMLKMMVDCGYIKLDVNCVEGAESYIPGNNKKALETLFRVFNNEVPPVAQQANVEEEQFSDIHHEVVDVNPNKENTMTNEVKIPSTEDQLNAAFNVIAILTLDAKIKSMDDAERAVVSNDLRKLRSAVRDKLFAFRLTRPVEGEFDVRPERSKVELTGFTGAITADLAVLAMEHFYSK